MKKFIRIRTVLVGLTILTSAIAIWSFLQNRVELGLESMISVLVCVISLLAVGSFRESVKKAARAEGSAGPKYASSVSIPFISVSADNSIVWYNDSFKELILKGEERFGDDIRRFLDRFDITAVCSSDGQDIYKDGKHYNARGVMYAEESGQTCLVWFSDVTKLSLAVAESSLNVADVMLMIVDNYDELIKNAKEEEKGQLIGRLEAILENSVLKFGGFFVRLERNKYMLMMDERLYQSMKERQFEILERIKDISSLGGVSATISAGLGRGGDSLNHNRQLAGQALDMAMGRGGDQVAVKTPDRYEFFGGNSAAVERYSRIHTRVVATSLSELIKSSTGVLVMSHKYSDFDAVGSGYAIWSLAKGLGKPAAYVMDKETSLASTLIGLIQTDTTEEIFYDSARAMDLVGEKPLLIIVDVHRASLLEDEQLYKSCKKVAVIDHHRKATEYIDNSVLFYHEPFASSTCEMVSLLLEYTPAVKVSKGLSEALMAGLMLDTKGFIMKTGVRTFEVAAWLKQKGADVPTVKRLFSASMENYRFKAQTVAAAEIYHKCALSLVEGSHPDIRTIVPQAADELLAIENIEASFVMYESDGFTNISARSMGSINVQVILEAFGGGGHQTMAGAQLEGAIATEVMDRIKEEIDKYLAAKQKAEQLKSTN